jgi:hypothetical protein
VCDLVDPLLLLQGGVGQHNHAVFLDQLLCQLSCLLNITSLVVRSFLSDSRWGNEFIYKRSYRYCMSDTVPIEVISNTQSCDKEKAQQIGTYVQLDAYRTSS